MANHFNNTGAGAGSLPAAQAQALAQTLLQQATAFQQKGQLAQAQSLYESLLRLQPNHSEALQAFGLLAQQMQRFALAIELLTKALASNPKAAHLHANLAQALLAAERYDAALLHFEQALAHKPDATDVHVGRGIALSKLQRNDEALTSFDTAIALDPQHAEAICQRGVILLTSARNEEALACIEQAIALSPRHAEALLQRAIALHHLDRASEALNSCDQAIALVPTNAAAHYRRGLLLRELQHPQEAVPSFDQAIALMPYFPEAYCQRGMALCALEQWREALSSYDKAIALQPDNDTARRARELLLTQCAASSSQPLGSPAVTPPSVRLTQSTVSNALPVPRGFEMHYDNYRYAPNPFAERNTLVIDGHEIRVVEIVDRPQIVVFDNVLSAAECELLIELSRPRLQPTPTFNREDGGKAAITKERTSEGMGFERGENALVRSIEQRIAKLMNFPLAHGEPLNILHYGVGAEYLPHFDFIAPEDNNSAYYLRNGGQRIATLVMYLNNVEGGGETTFPAIDFAVAPRKGSAVFFSYFDSEGKLDRLSLHSGAPVAQGEKWIVTQWVRQNAWQVPPRK